MGDGSLHVVVFPWAAFGHMLPFLELSKSLARRGHHISFISTPRNLQRLPKIPSQISHLLHFVSFPLPRVEGLPETAEATSDVPPMLVKHLKKAFDGLEQPFSKFIQEAIPKPDWIVIDFAHHYVPKVASKIGVPCIFFSGFPAFSLAFFGPPSELGSRKMEEFIVSPPWVPFPSKVVYRLHEVRQLLQAAPQSDSGEDSDANHLKLVIEGCKAVAPRSCIEMESEWLCLLQELYKKPVIPVGLLPPPVHERGKNHENDVQIMEWLDKQSSRSVIYVAFGTEVMLRTELLHEVAFGLEHAKLPFLWALRKPVGSSDDMDMLPKGFEDRTSGHGIVAMGWVSQIKVLAHGSVGGFLTHCGWGSIVEGLQFGHPLVLLPIFWDQGLNARVMEEKGIGVEVERKEKDGSFTREEVAKALRLIMVDEEGELYRNKANKMREVISNKGCQEKYVDDFIEFLKGHSNQEG